MSLLWLSLLYLAAGLGIASFVASKSDEPLRARAATFALVTLLWPLWAPIALGGDRPREPEAAHGSPLVARIRDALDEAVSVAEGSPLSSLLTRAAADRIASEAARAAVRAAELDALLARGLDASSARARIDALIARGASERALATARLSLESAERMSRLRDADRRALEELAELADALRTQLILLRHAGSSGDGAGSVIAELWGRVEGVGHALEGGLDSGC